MSCVCLSCLSLGIWGFQSQLLMTAATVVDGWDRLSLGVWGFQSQLLMTVATVADGWDCLGLGGLGFSVTVVDDDCRHSC